MGKVIGFLILTGGFFTLKYFVYGNVSTLYLGIPLLIVGSVLPFFQMRDI